MKAGVVEKSGAWFSHDSQRIGQGRENAKQFLRDNPKMAEAIEKKIRDQSSTIADALMAADDGEDEQRGLRFRSFFGCRLVPSKRGGLLCSFFEKSCTKNF